MHRTDGFCILPTILLITVLDQFDPLSARLTLYVAANWLLLVVTLAALVFIYARHRYLFVKPSIFLIGLAHLLFQWPLAIYSGYYETWLPRPYDIVVLIHGAVLVGLFGSTLMFRASARSAWVSVTTPHIDDSPARRIAIPILFGLSVVLTAIYLTYVRFECTGLYVLITNPRWAPLAREYSMKLLADPVPRYALSLLSATVAPLLVALVTVEIWYSRAKFTLRNGVYFSAAVVSMFSAFLSGANFVLAGLFVVIAFVVLWERRLTISLVSIPLLLGSVLLPAFLLFYTFSLIGSGHLRVGSADYDYSQCAPLTDEVKQALVIADTPAATPTPAASSHQRALPPILQTAVAQASAVLRRAFVIPFQVGGWYVHYEQTRGPIGIGAVPRIARILGVPTVEGPSLIGKTYGPAYYGRPVPDSIWASAGYWFTYYGYFGRYAFVLLPILLWLTDIALWVYRRSNPAFHLAMAGAISLSVTKFLDGDYTAVWLTHGFGVIMILVLALSWLGRGFEPKLRSAAS